jgi:hypothetical protein
MYALIPRPFLLTNHLYAPIEMHLVLVRASLEHDVALGVVDFLLAAGAAILLDLLEAGGDWVSREQNGDERKLTIP